MPHAFHRNQNAAERTAKLNQIDHRLDRVEVTVEALQQDASGDSNVYDPGDLTVYYENGKA